MYCEKCGKELNEGARFCDQCGAMVGKNNSFVDNRAPMPNNSVSLRYGLGTATLRKLYFFVGLLSMAAFLFTGTVTFSAKTNLGLIYAEYKGDEMGFEASVVKIFLNMAEDSKEFTEIFEEAPIVGFSLVVLVGSAILMLIGYLTSITQMKEVTKFLPRVKLYFTSATVFFISDCVLVYTLNDELGYEILACGKPILVCGIIAIVMLVLFKYMYVKAYNSENYEET